MHSHYKWGGGDSSPLFLPPEQSKMALISHCEVYFENAREVGRMVGLANGSVVQRLLVRHRNQSPILRHNPTSPVVLHHNKEVTPSITTDM